MDICIRTHVKDLSERIITGITGGTVKLSSAIGRVGRLYISEGLLDSLC